MGGPQNISMTPKVVEEVASFLKFCRPQLCPKTDIVFCSSLTGESLTSAGFTSAVKKTWLEAEDNSSQQDASAFCSNLFGQSAATLVSILYFLTYSFVANMIFGKQ